MTNRSGMSHLRLLLAWLLLAAIPLQGFAAASMLYCGVGTPHGSQVQTQAKTMATGGHDHASHSHGQAAKAGKTADGKSQLPDPSHKCGVCASCCNGVALTGTPHVVTIAALSPADAAEPFVLIHRRPSKVPDKPPRA